MCRNVMVSAPPTVPKGGVFDTPYRKWLKMEGFETPRATGETARGMLLTSRAQRGGGILRMRQGGLFRAARCAHEDIAAAAPADRAHGAQ
jgi:hypothetical protein